MTNEAKIKFHLSVTPPIPLPTPSSTPNYNITTGYLFSKTWQNAGQILRWKIAPFSSWNIIKDRFHMGVVGLGWSCSTLLFPVWTQILLIALKCKIERSKTFKLNTFIFFTVLIQIPEQTGTNIPEIPVWKGGNPLFRLQYKFSTIAKKDICLMQTFTPKN